MRYLVTALLVLLLGGCQLSTGTRVEEVSSRPASAAPLKKLLLVGLTATPELQSAMEQAFARRLAGPGRELVLASQWFPGQKLPLREEVLSRLRAEGVTGVLAVRLLGYEVEGGTEGGARFSLRAPPRVPGARVGWEQEPGGGEPAPAPGRWAEVETRLYDVASGSVLWQARSRSPLHGDTARELDGFVAAIVAELHRSGWR